VTSLTSEQLRAERTQWVLKSDYGCEGDEVICGPFVSQEIWDQTLAHARPEHFVAQRFFNAQVREDGTIANHGVYVLGGSACGFFTRLSRQGTDYSSVSVPTFVAREE
jgi:hypothetical protein